MYSSTICCDLPPLYGAPKPPRQRSTPSLSAPSRDDPEALRSTWPQRAWTLAGSAAIISSVSTTASLAADSGSFVEPLAAALAAYSLADLSTGFFHWFIDNYGDASTPFLGGQIAAAQGHHRYPSTIALREPCNNLHALARGVALGLPLLDAAAAPAPAAAHAFAASFAACVLLSQQCHAWAHEKRRRLPPVVEALQDAGILLSRTHHAEHHRPPAPYSSNYCIVSGMWNAVLDRNRVFEALEMVIFLRTGIRPRSWDEPDWRKKEAGDNGFLLII